MLHPSTESPSRDARSPRRPGVFVLPAAALAALLIATAVVAASVTTRGDTDDGDRRAAPSAPAAGGTDTPSRSGGTGGSPDGGTDGVGEGRAAGTPGQRPSAQGESASPLPAPTQKRAVPARTDRGRTSPPKDTTGTPGTSGTAKPRPRPTADRRAATAAPRAPYDALRVGDCFDIARDAPGTVVRRACDTPHDAELVARLRLTGAYADDRAVRDAAAALCRAPLRAEAAQQPLGTRWATFVQYPYRTSYLLGSDTVACSLAAPSDSGRKLTSPLQ
ncbi:hypothetical protein ABZ135_22165 [Streptomyces sp. NPDC006339]|uniref:hypothetical protein n=1 Tax=Streptomyces sp. NPDC006339 TaxID=3156755 RepID=UPI0033B736FA